MLTDVTVGIPTFRRPDLLERAILSVLNQTYKKITLNISVDYFERNHQEYVFLRNKYKSFKNVNFFFQNENIGSLQNFLFLSNQCKTEFFMWLADDDEMSETLIESLKKKIITSGDIACVCPYWNLRNYEKDKTIKPKTFDSKSLLMRVFKYLNYSDDVFFYGLHRSQILKKAKFNGYCWPNNKSLANWCYVLQFDVLLNGKISLVDEINAKWINHDYGTKFYISSIGSSFFKYFAYFVRRINIYFFYIKKAFLNKKPIILLFLLLVSPYFLIRDLLFGEPIYKDIKF